MKYAKLINGIPSYAPNPILIDGFYIGNPPGAVYEAEGYKPVVYSDPPGEAPIGYQWVESWSEGDGNIIQGWVQEELPPEEPSAEELLEILLGGTET